MTKKQFMKELKALRNGWHTGGPDGLIRNKHNRCPLRAVARAKGIGGLGLMTTGRRLGLTSQTTDAIIFAADGVPGRTRELLLEALF